MVAVVPPSSSSEAAANVKVMARSLPPVFRLSSPCCPGQAEDLGAEAVGLPVHPVSKLASELKLGPHL